MTEKLVYSMLLVLSAVMCLCTVACGNAAENATISRLDSLSAANPHAAVACIDSAIRTDSAHMSRHGLMRLKLLRARVRNTLGMPLPSEQDAMSMADYFEKHGTDNERMSAYYVLGSVYSQGDRPMDALRYCDMSATSADTLSDICDYRTLAIVYSLRANVFEDNFLFDNALDSWRKAYAYSLKTTDEYLKISLLASMGDTYYLMGDAERTIAICKEASVLFAKNGYLKDAEFLLGTMAFYYFETDSVLLAQQFAAKYVCNTMLFDNNGNLREGNDIYYYIKGRLCLEENKLDSAKMAFEVLSKDNTDNFKQASFKGLYLLYKKEGIADSIVKYAELWNSCADSSYRKASMAQLNKMQYAYGYSQKEKDLLIIKAKSQNVKYGLLILCCILVMLAMVSYIIVKNKNIRIKIAQERMAVLKSLIKQREEKLKNMQNKMSDSECSIGHYKDKIQYLSSEIANLKDEILVHQDVEKLSGNAGNDILSLVKAKSKKRLQLSIKEKNCFVAYTRKENQHFGTLVKKNVGLTEKEMLVCCFIISLIPQHYSS